MPRGRKGTGRKKKMRVGYMISAVAEKYSLHPQTLRLYEREGLITPSRSEATPGSTPQRTWSGSKWFSA